MKDLNPTERRIIASVIAAALRDGLQISVNDGEETTVSRSTDRAAIADAIGTTDETTLTFWAPKPDKAATRVGAIWLVHGNEEDVISDCTDVPRITRLCDLATAKRITLDGKIGGFQ